jgi:hypothetical protein
MQQKFQSIPHDLNGFTLGYAFLLSNPSSVTGYWDGGWRIYLQAGDNINVTTYDYRCLVDGRSRWVRR